MPELNRKRTLLLGTISNYGAIGVSIVVGLISVPLGLHYFGPVLYGIWFVITSILAYLRISDFGIGLSTLTLMAKAPDAVHQRVILRCSIKLLLCISVVCIGIMLIVNYLFPGWVGILGKVPPNLQGKAATAALATGILMFFQLPTTVFAAAFSGLQQVYWNRAYSALRSITALGALVATILVRGNLITLAIFTGLGGLLVGIISGVHLFLIHPDIRPRVGEKVADAPSSKLLFTSGVRFLILQIASLIIWNTDNLVISHFLGPLGVTPYAVTFKLFQMGLLVVNAVTDVLWPMYGQASGQGDWDWIQRTYNCCVPALMVAGGLIWIGGILFSKEIISIWAGPSAYGGVVVAFALGGYVYISSFGGANHSLVNGLNPTNIVVIFGLIEATLNLVISLILVKPFGIGGVALGTFIASLTVNTWFPPLYIRRRTFRKVSIKVRPILTHALIVISSVILSLIVVLHLPVGWMRLIVNIIIITIYLALSWRLMSDNLHNLIRGVLGEFPVLKSFCLVKERK